MWLLIIEKCVLNFVLISTETIGIMVQCTMVVVLQLESGAMQVKGSYAYCS